MTTSLGCRLGHHHWRFDIRQLDIDEPPRQVAVCTHCQKISLGGSRFHRDDRPENPDGTGMAAGFGGGVGMGDGGGF